VRTADFEYHLPCDLIAQAPAPQRDESRLLALRRADGGLAHRQFRDLLDYLEVGDVLVLNDSRVMPARLRGRKTNNGGEIELLLLEESGVNDWWVMLRPGKRVHPGTKTVFTNRDSVPISPNTIEAVALAKNSAGHCRLRFSGTPDIAELLDLLGEVPLPPYIARDEPWKSADDRERYQTVFAREYGSVAAPTAGLHFTKQLLNTIRERGVQVCFVTLHVGLGTFAPVKVENVEHHVMHEERFHLDADAADTINQAKSLKRRVIAVGTTTLRVLESVAADNAGRMVPTHGRTRIFIYPPCPFRITDGLLTNFHLPRSTLLMLACAFAAPGELRGRELVLAAYAEAVRQRYRFYSYGDAMLIF